MSRYGRLFWHYVRLRIQVMAEYRVDFLIGVLSVLLIQGAGLFFVHLVFQKLDNIRGWQFEEVVFIYGLACSSRAIHHVFFDNLWLFGREYLRNGGFERLLVRPVPAFFQLVAERVQQDGVGQLAIGIWLLSYAMPKLDVEWTVVQVMLLIALIFAGTLVFIGVHVITCSLSFWMIDSMPVQWSVHEMSDFARYPLSIYRNAIQALLTWIIPYGFTAFYPATVFLQPETFSQMAWMTPLVGVGLCIVGMLVWRRGIRNFSGTGS
jgi:ABC-2 type transport system permease protein